MSKLWLDDVRLPPDGWIWCKSVSEAKALLLAGPVEEASLDFDLNLAVVGQAGGIVQAILLHGPQETGLDLLKWMARENVWPHQKPTVHSEHPSAPARMRALIDKHWKEPPHDP